MKLPPTTIEEALAFYRALVMQPEVVTTDPALAHAAAMILVLGDRLGMAADSVMALVELNHALAQIVEHELDVDVERVLGPQELESLRNPVLPSTVEWHGSSGDYFDNMEAINKAITREFFTPIGQETVMEDDAE